MKKEVTGHIQFYSRKGREQIVERARQIVHDEGLAHLSDDILAIVDELIKNAIKANYKFLLIKDAIHRRILMKNALLKAPEIKARVDAVIANRKEYNDSAREILLAGHVSDRVRAILNEESRFLAIKNRADRENRPFTDVENRTIGDLALLASIKKMTNDSGMKIFLSIAAAGGTIVITVTNTAPILAEDLKRIRQKREDFRKLKMKNREVEFFVNHIDTTEAGHGLGYARVDAILYQWGLEAPRVLTIEATDVTAITLRLPVKALRTIMGR